MNLVRIKNIARLLLGDQLWDLNLENFSNAKRRAVKFIKLIRITVDEFAENRMGFQCVALSYFTALAIVPFAAFIFAVGGGLGLDIRIGELLYRIFPNYPEAIDAVLENAQGIISAASSGVVGVIGAATFLWAVIWLMFQVERVFNNVWKIRKIPRKIYKRFSFYFLALILSPFVVLLFGGGIAFYSNLTSLVGIRVHIRDVSAVMTFLGWVIFYAIAVLTFSALYKFLPATRVYYKNAFPAAMVSGLVFMVFQFLYLKTQIFVTRLNAVYGVIAAIPLFLMWMNYSWQIIIYGAQLCYGIQNVDLYHIPEGKLRDFTPMRDRLRDEFTQEMEEDQ